MDRFPPQARLTRVKCIPCNAPATRTINENYVCVSCGETVVSLDGGSAGPTTDPGQDDAGPRRGSSEP